VSPQGLPKDGETGASGRWHPLNTALGDLQLLARFGCRVVCGVRVRSGVLVLLGVHARHELVPF
jgi:hypothetical protein